MGRLVLSNVSSSPPPPTTPVWFPFFQVTTWPNLNAADRCYIWHKARMQRGSCCRWISKVCTLGDVTEIPPSDKDDERQRHSRDGVVVWGRGGWNRRGHDRRGSRWEREKELCCIFRKRFVVLGVHFVWDHAVGLIAAAHVLSETLQLGHTQLWESYSVLTHLYFVSFDSFKTTFKVAWQVVDQGHLLKHCT